MCMENVREVDLRERVEWGESFGWRENGEGWFEGMGLGKKVRVRVEGEGVYMEK